VSAWRDTTSQAVQDDLDSLVTPAIDAAAQLLNKNGEFFPFCLTVGLDGELGFDHADPGLGEQPPSQAVLDFLYEGAAAQQDTLRALAFVADVRLEGSDAVRVELEHRDGGPGLAVLAPYALRGLVRKRARFGDLQLAKGTRHIWT
jgi:hypothetical protein